MEIKRIHAPFIAHLTTPQNPAIASCHPRDVPLAAGKGAPKHYSLSLGALHSEYASQLSIRLPYSQYVYTLFIDKKRVHEEHHEKHQLPHGQHQNKNYQPLF